jgi:hypothetical protein
MFIKKKKKGSSLSNWLKEMRLLIEGSEILGY